MLAIAMENAAQCTKNDLLGRDPAELDSIVLSGKIAKEEFILHNLRLVRTIALRNRKVYKDVDVEDLFQMGVIGLIRAVEKWNWRRGYQFSTYATWWIRQSISRNAMDTANLVRIPIYMLADWNTLQQKKIEFEDATGLMPNDLDLLEVTGFNSEKIEKIENSVLEYESIHRHLDKYGEIEPRFFWDDFERSSIEDPYDLVERQLLLEQIKSVLDTLSDRESGVISLRFGIFDGEPKTLEYIGNIYNVTRERIRQIEAKVMLKLRHPSRSQVLRDYL